MGLTNEQKAERRFRIGASEIAAIFGDNPYCTPFELAVRKTGRYSVDPSSPAIDLGNRLEPILLDRIEEIYGKKLVRGKEFRVAKVLPIVATTDAVFEDRSKVVEAKAVNIVYTDYRALDNWTDDIYPRMYYWQVQTQMIAAEISEGVLTALVGGKGFMDYDIPLELDVMSEAVEKAVDWWDRHVVLDNPPPPTPLDFDVLQKTKPIAGKSIELSEEYEALVDELEACKRDKKSAEDREKEIKAELASAIGLAERAVLPNGWEISYLMRKRAGFTAKATEFRVMEVKR